MDNLRDKWLAEENKKKEAFRDLMKAVKGTPEHLAYTRAKRKAKRARDNYAKSLQTKETINE